MDANPENKGYLIKEVSNILSSITQQLGLPRYNPMLKRNSLLEIKWKLNAELLSKDLHSYKNGLYLYQLINPIPIKTKSYFLLENSSFKNLNILAKLSTL